MEISISTVHSKDMDVHTRFVTARCDNIAQICNTICGFQWSPITWAYGRRKGINFVFADFLVLDFDDGVWTLEDAMKAFDAQGCGYIIGTTKSHQIQKGSLPPCDRFRVLLKWHRRITDRETYLQNMKRVAKDFPCDQQCVDAARSYQPCIEIIKICTGSGIEWRPFVPRPKPIPTVYQVTGILPYWLKAMMQETPHQGMRNKHAFRLAAKLAEHGYSEQDTIEAVLLAPIDLTQEEMTNAARSGFIAGKRSCKR